MSQEIDFLSSLHQSTPRNYLQRVLDHDKPTCAERAKLWGVDYWDGERCYGYGGMRYDGRWRSVAEAMAAHYQLRPGQRILDIGCGKGYLLYEFTQVVPGIEVYGLDISSYALAHAKPELKDRLTKGSCVDLPWPDDYFDFVYSITTLHNLFNYELYAALNEIERVTRKMSHIVVESYRNEQEKANLLYWQLTCESFYTPDEWRWCFQQAGFQGDYSFIYFT